MGYYTQYELTIDNNSNVSDECLQCSASLDPSAKFCSQCGTARGKYGIIELFRNENEEAAYALENDGSTCESTKWYNYQEDLEKFSRKFPDVLFTLSGEGEESGDIWKLYVKNGKSQKAEAKIVIAEFDEKLLK